MDYLQTIYNQVSEMIGGYLPSVLGALFILVIGWLIALVISSLLRRLFRKTTIDERLGTLLTGKETSDLPNIGDWLARGVFYLIMLFVLVAFFEALQLTLITEPINNLLNQLFAFAPQVLGAGVLLLVAWGVATILRVLVNRGLTAAKLDERIQNEVDDSSEKMSLTNSLSDVVYWLIFLLFLPAVLSTLELNGLLTPIQGMLNKVMGFVPNIFTAGIILLVGWFVARIIQRIISNLLRAAGVDQLSERVGLSNALGKLTLSSVLGLIVYTFILIPVLVAALNALSLDAITAPASNMLNMILEALPAIFAAALILGIAYVVGKVVAGLISNLLTGIGFDGLLGKMGFKDSGKADGLTPSGIVGYIALLVIMFFAVTEASNVLGFQTLAVLVTQFTLFASRILLGLIIFALGLYLARWVSTTIKDGGSNQANILALAAQSAILVLAGAMALRQMGLANEIITIAFGALLGAIAVAVAIAFGIGGRDLAADKLAEWSKSISKNSS